MQNTDSDQINGENIIPLDGNNNREIQSVQKSFQAKVLLGTLGLFNFTRDILGILPEEKNPAKMIKMLEQERQKLLKALEYKASNDEEFVPTPLVEASNDSNFNEKKVA